MLKHGLFTSDKFQSYMSFAIEEGFFIIETMNAVDRQTKKLSSGAGLKNIEGRLRFIYSDLVEFKADKNDDGFFLVKIKIPTSMMINA